jgi:hypothetical protein
LTDWKSRKHDWRESIAIDPMSSHGAPCPFGESRLPCGAVRRRSP